VFGLFVVRGWVGILAKCGYIGVDLFNVAFLLAGRCMFLTSCGWFFLGFMGFSFVIYFCSRVLCGWGLFVGIGFKLFGYFGTFVYYRSVLGLLGLFFWFFWFEMLYSECWWLLLANVLWGWLVECRFWFLVLGRVLFFGSVMWDVVCLFSRYGDVLGHCCYG